MSAFSLLMVPVSLAMANDDGLSLGDLLSTSTFVASAVLWRLAARPQLPLYSTAPTERTLIVKSSLSARLIACLVTFFLIVLAWLGFAYLMRDTPQLGSILDGGLWAVLVMGFGLFLVVVNE